MGQVLLGEGNQAGNQAELDVAFEVEVRPIPPPPPQARAALKRTSRALWDPRVLCGLVEGQRFG